MGKMEDNYLTELSGIYCEALICVNLSIRRLVLVQQHLSQMFYGRDDFQMNYSDNYIEFDNQSLR